LWLTGLLLSALTVVYGATNSVPLLSPSVPADTMKVTVKKTSPVVEHDLKRQVSDLQDPENLKREETYDVDSNFYYVGTKMGEGYLNTPVLMSPEEYHKWTLRRSMADFYRQKNQEDYNNNGKSNFDFLDAQFSLGPAEKIFGPGGVRIKTQGTAELKFGGTIKSEDNPALPVNNRRTTAFDFDMKVNLSLNGKVGDKVNLNLSYDTEATFDFDSKNLKLKYEGKEDEIIKLVEAGNISMPTNSSLIKGASSLFGVRTDLQFGKLKMQLVASQKKSSTKSVSSKGGTQLHDFEIGADAYVENRFFFLSNYFRDNYDKNLQNLPNITSGIQIKRVEVWMTNKTGSYENQRNVLSFTDLGEEKSAHLYNDSWVTTGMRIPSNSANTLYAELNQRDSTGVRDISQANTYLDGFHNMQGGLDYEKIQSARKLTSSEYTVNTALGYIQLKTTLQTDEVLAIAYEYTYGGQTYQVGEFAADITDNSKALFLKSLKNTDNSPGTGTWNLMMRNVYSLGASSIQKDKFKLDIKFQNDSAGVYTNYLPEAQFKSTPLLKMMNLDRLDNNNKLNSNGQFDYVEGYTILASYGYIIFPVVEPFGDHLRSKLGSEELAEKYCFDELYDSTKTVAKQIAEKDKFILTGRYSGSSGSEIDLGTGNVPRGSVVVTAGGVTLTENSDYTVDYSSGRVTIINQSIIDAGTAVNVSLESNDYYGMQRKTMVGMNLEYEVSKNFILGGTLMHLSEQALTTKVSMGEEPLNNTIWGLNMSWKKESQWLTNLLNKIPLLHLTAPSSINFTGEFAQLIAGQNGDIQDGASYIDDFENTKNGVDMRSPTSWVICSTPTGFEEASLSNDVRYGYRRAKLAWYYIDPLFTRRSSNLTPSHIKSDLNQLSNHYVREVYEREVYPNKSLTSTSSTSSTLNILNLAYYPSERGPYNLNTNLDINGHLTDPYDNWGGMMRKIETSDFETSNIGYIEFWLMDPFIYTRGSAGNYSGKFYIDLGEVSEDILKDGKKFYESGMPLDGSSTYYTETVWGRVPTQSSVTYAFNTSSGSRNRQDVGFNGLTDEEEQNFGAYRDYLSAIQGKVSPEVFDSIYADPAGDDYHYFRGSDYDAAQRSILERYKNINSPAGNSPDSEGRTESYDTSYKSIPDAEDINTDYTMNEYEKFYRYEVDMDPNLMEVGQNFISDIRTASVKLRNGETENVNWYQFRIPIDQYVEKKGGISDFTSIRFMRMFLTEFENPIVLRFATLDLVRADWRNYTRTLDSSTSSNSGSMAVSAVNYEENGSKAPVNYVLPPGISRVVDPSQAQLNESNEQALSIVINDLAAGDARAVYKNSNLDMRQYKHLQLFLHANALENDVTNLQDNDVSVFIRLGSDFRSNYYEYEIPMKLTPEGKYDNNSTSQRKEVWPEDNMLDVDLTVFTDVKKARNIAKNQGGAEYTKVFYTYDSDRPNNKISVLGNPSLGEVTAMMIGVRNNSNRNKSVEIWANEFRLQEFENSGGWAAQGNLNVQLSDLGTVNLTGHVETAGFGGLEEGVSSRRQDNLYEYSVTTNMEMGKFFPTKWRVNAPVYYSYAKEVTRPKYNPLNTDMLLDDALDACANKTERDSLEDIVIKRVISSNFSVSNVKFNVGNKRFAMPWDPQNFSLSYSHNKTKTTGETTVWEIEENWKANFNYSYSPSYKAFEPFKNLKGKSKWLDIIKTQNFNYLPQNLTFNSDITRTYYELQERDMEQDDYSSIPISFSEQFLWNRQFSIRWDFTKALHAQFSSATNAEIEEPYTVINKDLYPDRYEAWKDSVRTSLRNLGRPLSYQQSFSASYQVPINRIPIFSWITSDATYSSSYSWARGTELSDGTSLGNTINNQRTVNLNGKFNFETLYNYIPFLKQANDAAKASDKNAGNKKNTKNSSKDSKKDSAKDASKKDSSKDSSKDADAKDGKKSGKKSDKEEVVPTGKEGKATKGFSKEMELLPDTTLKLSHNLKTKYLDVKAITKDGRKFSLKYKVADDNTINILNKVKDTTGVKISIQRGKDPKEQTWYKVAQKVARVAMMTRSASFTYRNTYSMYLPGFMPNVGDMFGQRSDGGLVPGLDFAFGLTGDSYISRAQERGWLLNNDSVTSSATTNNQEDVQIKITLEPITNLKIDLNASRTITRAASIQYMYAGMPTTRSGSFTMTTISIGSAFQGTGNADNGYKNATFEKFCNLLDVYQQRVEARYAGTVYPSGEMAGKTFDPANGTISKYSADVMVPAFLEAYTGGSKGMDFFPSLSKILPNWSLSYNGLAKLPWFRDHFKSVTLSHAYKSVYSIGSYSTYSSWLEYMGDLGFVSDVTTGNLVPSSPYDISTVSINESFSPLLGLSLTFNNNLTTKLEYKSTRVLNLSMTSALLSETSSKDIVIGMGYKISDFKLFNFGGTKAKKVKSADRRKNTSSTQKNATAKKNETSKKGMNHEMNLRLDLSWRNQSALSRNIQTGLSEATSGNKALKLSFSADYTLSKLLTMSFYYDRQTNTPLLSSSSYPTTTRDFGLSMKFSLTR
jgi:cell surface protein SprA